MKNNSILLVFFAIIISSCNFFPKENTTYGENKIGVDGSLEPGLKSAFYMFDQTYKNAKIDYQFKPDLDISNELLADSLKIVILARKLDSVENKHLAFKKITPRYTPIAHDALVIILNKNNPDKLLSYENVMDIFKGEVKNWSQISKGNTCGEVQLIFDSQNSSTATYFMNELGINKLPPHSSAATSVNDVIDKVSKIKNAIGVVGLAWLGNLNDRENNRVNSLINIAYVRPKGSTKDEYFSPDQMNISDTLYPFRRTIYVIECSGGTTLGTGLASFIFAEQGQRILLKTGILPYWVPPRTINLK